MIRVRQVFAPEDQEVGAFPDFIKFLLKSFKKRSKAFFTRHTAVAHAVAYGYVMLRRLIDGIQYNFLSPVALLPVCCELGRCLGRDSGGLPFGGQINQRTGYLFHQARDSFSVTHYDKSTG